MGEKINSRVYIAEYGNSSHQWPIDLLRKRSPAESERARRLRARFVRSVRGRRGGYALAKDPTDITLAEIIRLFGGALAPTESVSENYYQPTPIEKEKKLTKVFKDIRDYILNKLEKTTIADAIK